MLWFEFSPNLHPDCHNCSNANSTDFTAWTPVYWSPLGKISTSFFCNRVRQWIKHQLYMNICFPDFCKAETDFDAAHNLFILKKPLLYTVKGHRSPVKGLAASHLKANTTKRLQLQSSFSFPEPWLFSAWTQSTGCLIKLRLRDYDTHICLPL